MKTTFAFLMGGASIFLSLSLFSGKGFILQLVIYWYALHLLFFHSSPRYSLSFLIGLTVAQELFGNQPFGWATILSFILYLLFDLLAHQIQLTDHMYRFLLTWLLITFLYPLLIQSRETILVYWPTLLLLYCLTSLTTLFIHSFKQSRQPTFL